MILNASNPGSTNQISSFSTFLSDFKKKLADLFHNHQNIDHLSTQRGIPPPILHDIMSTNPLSVCIPTQYGGRGGNVKECLSLMEAASYESLALSLTFGINIALFLQPFSKCGDKGLKGSVFSGFLNEHKMGGLMITEPGHGSDALHMQTSYIREEEFYHINGLKHWAGLTGSADYWLLAARQKTSQNSLSRDIDFFLCDVKSPGQQIVVEEKFNNLGLYIIPYGRNRLDVRVPIAHRLQPQTTGLKMMLDLLHHSRMMMPGIGLGFIKRNLQEAIRHSKERHVGGRQLFGYDQVQARIVNIQAAYTIISAMCIYSSREAQTEADLSSNGLEANVIKTVVSDLMHESAQSLLQLTGAKGYKLDHIAGRGIVDSRPFQIFEGSNDILYFQITESVIKSMKHKQEKHLFNFLKKHPISFRAAEYVKDITKFEPSVIFAQRKQVELGRAIARIFSIGFVLNLGDLGFRKDLINGAITILLQEIHTIMESYRFGDNPMVVEDYQENGEWLECLS